MSLTVSARTKTKTVLESWLHSEQSYKLRFSLTIYFSMPQTCKMGYFWFFLVNDWKLQIKRNQKRNWRIGLYSFFRNGIMIAKISLFLFWHARVLTSILFKIIKITIKNWKLPIFPKTKAQIEKVSQTKKFLRLILHKSTKIQENHSFNKTFFSGRSA